MTDHLSCVQKVSISWHQLTFRELFTVRHCNMHYNPPKSLTLQGNCLAFLTLEKLIQRQDVGAKFTLWPLKPVAAFLAICRDSDNVIKHIEALKMSEIQNLVFFLSIRSGNCQVHSGNPWKTNRYKLCREYLPHHLQNFKTAIAEKTQPSSADPHSHTAKRLPGKDGELLWETWTALSCGAPEHVSNSNRNPQVACWDTAQSKDIYPVG